MRMYADPYAKLKNTFNKDPSYRWVQCSWEARSRCRPPPPWAAGTPGSGSAGQRPAHPQTEPSSNTSYSQLCLKTELRARSWTKSINDKTSGRLLSFSGSGRKYDFYAVLWIHDILVRIPGSEPLINESGSCYYIFVHDLQDPNIKLFSLISFWRYIYIIFLW